MKQIFLLLLLSLGMLSFNVNAQTQRECIVEDDGFEWYKITKIDENEYIKEFGAEDRYGNTILPTSFIEIKYDCFKDYKSFSSGCGFIVCKREGGLEGIRAYYLRNGKCVIPFTRRYVDFSKYTRAEFGTYYICTVARGRGIYGTAICDNNGKEVLSINGYKQYDIGVNFSKGVFYISINKYKANGIIDGNGKIIVEPKYEKPISLNPNGHNFGYIDDTGNWISVASVTSMSTKSNPLANNSQENFDETILVSTRPPKDSSSSSSSSSSSLYSDAQSFGFKGKVKKCEWYYQISPLDSYPWPNREIHFSTNGKIILDNYEIDRDSNGRILKIEKGITTYKFTYDNKNRINCIEHIVFNIFGADIVKKYFYTYDSEDRIISSNYEHDLLGKVSFIYSRFINDSNGNWIECYDTTTNSKTSYKYNNKPKRKIEYY